MKNSLLNKTLIGLTILLSMLDMSWADTTTSVAVSFTIPVMPGLNAPLVEDETVAIPANTNEQKKLETFSENSETTPALIQQDTQKEALTAKEEQTTKMVKTIYTR